MHEGKAPRVASAFVCEALVVRGIMMEEGERTGDELDESLGGKGLACRQGTMHTCQP